jgi:hypothetical protein
VGYNNPSIPWSELEQKLSGGALRSERLFNEAKFSKGSNHDRDAAQHEVPGPIRPIPRAEHAFIVSSRSPYAAARFKFALGWATGFAVVHVSRGVGSPVRPDRSWTMANCNHSCKSPRRRLRRPRSTPESRAGRFR